MPETPKNPPPQCHVHDKVWDAGIIRKNVCVPAGEYPLQEFQRRHYCLFHLPTQNKDVDEFSRSFYARLDEIDEKCREIEGEFPDDEKKQAEAKRERRIKYDFRSVWFPQLVDFIERKFSAFADFSSAVFSASADFRSATFPADASFRFAIFSARAYFSLTTFSAFADFRSTTFSAFADFSSAIFSANANFGSATFSAETHFDKAKFSETNETSFYKSNFTGDTFFDLTEFNGDVVFNSVVFGGDSDVIFRGTKFGRKADFQYCASEGYLRFSDLQLRSRSRFDFQEAAFEKASRVSFHTISLRPCWFVNVDSRKFVFTDIIWRNLDWDFRNKNIYAEIDSMADTGAALQKKRILEVAARQLAVNAEENNRYDEAAKFRYMAMETRRLEETKRFRASRFLMWLYKWSSGYGESWGRAALVLLLIWLGFGLAYRLFGSFQIETPLDVWQSLGYSSQVMLLQKPNPRPLSNLTFTLYILETIFAPLQAALLALAIRRKFMR